MDFRPDEEKNPGDFLDLIALMIHSADLYVPTKSPEISKAWSERVNREFIDQYRDEQDRNLAPTAFYAGLDDIVVRAKSEQFFTGSLVAPLWKILDVVLDNKLSKLITQIEENKRYWSSIAESQNQHKDEKKLGTK